jgi:DNA-binding NarL/FixJ family response regulator
VLSPRHDGRGTEPIDIAAVPPRPVSGRSHRAAYHTPRRRKLTAEQEVAIRALAATKSLRSLADEFGVSHETVRKVVCGRQAAGAT